jgi:hypothetical protein
VVAGEDLVPRRAYCNTSSRGGENMSQQLYDAVMSGNIKLDDLNETGRSALKSYASAIVASEGGGDVGFDPEVSDPSLQYRAANPIAAPQEAEVYSPEGGYVAPATNSEPLWNEGDAQKVAFQALKVPYNLGFRGGPETDSVVNDLPPMPTFSKGDMQQYQESMAPQSPLGKVAGWGAEQVGLLPFYAATELAAGAGLASGAGKGLSWLSKIAPKAAPAIEKAAPYAQTFASGFGSGAPVGMMESYGAGESLPDVAKAGLESGLTFGGFNVGMKGVGSLIKKGLAPKVETRLPIETPQPKAELPAMPTIAPKVSAEVKPTGSNNLTREGSISAAKFTIPEKQAAVGDEQVRSFMVTGMESPITHPETKAGLLVDTFEGGPGGYKKQTHAMTEEGSRQFLADEGLEKSVDYVLHTTDVNAYRMGLGKEVIVKLQEQGNISKAVDVYETLAKTATEAGQLNEAVKLFKALTPEGVGMKAAKDAKKAYDKLPEPAKKKHAKATDDVQVAFDEINKDTVEEVIKQTAKLNNTKKQTESTGQGKQAKEIDPAELLAQRIKQYMSTPKEKESDPIKDMVSTLFKKAKEVLPKQQVDKIPRDEMEFIRDAIANKEKYKAVWDEAKKVLKDKYGDSPGVMDSVDSFINHYINIPYSEGAIGKITRAGIKDGEINLSQLVREHYTVQTKAGNDLVNKLVDVGGMAKQDAQTLAMEIGTKFEQIATKKKQQILDQMFTKRMFGKKKPIDDYMIELSNLGALSKEQYRRLVAEKLELPVFSEDMAKQLMKLANDAQTLKGREAEIARGKIKEVLSLLHPASTGQKIDSFRRIAMLLNPKTHVRNIGGNVILGAFENIKDVPGSLVDMGITAARKARGVEGVTRTTLMPSPAGLKEQGKGFIEGFGRVVSDVKNKVDTTPKGQYEIPAGKSFDSKFGKALEGTTNTLLKGGDVPFYQAAYRDALRQQMKIHKVDTPTQTMKDFATNVAEHRTFQNDSEIARGVKYLQGALNKIGSAVGLGSEQWGFGNVVFPFVKTLGNIMDKAVEYSPVGVIRAGRLAYQGNKMGNFDQKAFVDAIGRTVVGSATILLGYDLRKAGVITGQQDKDSDVASFKRNTGENPYSFNTSAAIRLVTGRDPAPQKGDVIRTYDFAQPISVALAIGADIYNGVKNRKEASNMVVEAIKSGGNTLMKQSVMQGVQKMMGGYDAMQGIMDTILETPLQFTPTLGGQIAKATDSTARETYSTTATGEIGNKIKAKLPVLSKTLPAKFDTLGRPMDSVQGGNTIFNTFFNPSTTKKYNMTDVEQKITNVYKATGDKTVFPRSVKDYKSFPVSGLKEEIALTPQEYAQFQKRIGEITNEKFTAVKTDDMTAAAKEMNKIMDAAVVTAKTEVLQARGHTVVKKGAGIAVE